MTECLRVLKPTGVLIFKWSDNQIPFSEMLKILPKSPILGDKRGHTRWYVILHNQPDDIFDDLPFW